MKIGILSMQRVNNYGSFWQAYCLKKILTEMKHTVEFIDIIPGHQIHESFYKRSYNLSKVKRLPYYLFHYQRCKLFQQFQVQKLGCTEQKNYSSDYDRIMIGSDEVFNFVQDSPWGYSTQLYGGIYNPNVSTYAASFGYSVYEDIKKYGLEDSMRNALQNLKHISVRDSNSQEIIAKLLPNTQVERHLDPVLVGALPVPSPSQDKKDYIVIYAYDFRFKDQEYINCIRRIARAKHMKIYSVGFYQDWVDENILPTPYDLLHWFRNAKYVITDTFHGTIFSIRCHRKFLTIVRDTNLQKLTSLLQSVRLEQRLICSAEGFYEKLKEEIDYDAVEIIRKQNQERSISYLKKCIDEKK
ncbi:MAG: polysaccharide pyruvyl transferase family protein [Oscillospiraceae bacterium]|nr:polysaccharide pyruvyl transferase family protein [Oscillospiraceae bacterium]